MTSFSDGCTNSDVPIPQLEVVGDLALGTDVFLRVSGAPMGSQVVFVGGASSTRGRSGCGLTVETDMMVPVMVTDQAPVTLALPLSLATAETSMYIQVGVITPGNPGNFSVSDRVLVEYFINTVSTAKLVQAFAGNKIASADAAYLELINRGVEGIEELILLAGSVGPAKIYAGRGFYDTRSSWVAQNPVPVRRMALYLIDGVLRDTATPAHAPIAFMDAPITDPDLEFLAAFQNWWGLNSGLGFGQLKAAPGPLDVGHLNWAGHYFAEALPAPARGKNGCEVAGSSTPVPTVNGQAIVQGTYGPGELDLVGSTSAEPYNCLSHALGCKTDRWTQPGGTTSMQDIMEGQGYTREGEFEGEATEKVEISFNSDDVILNNGDWSHAIKTDPNTGVSSSKNGDGPLYEGITDTGAFRGEHYPPGPGEKTIVEVWCK